MTVKITPLNVNTHETWTPARIAYLRRRWPHDSATQIGKALGLPGRDHGKNAVIGKVHRLGLAPKARSPRRSIAHKQARSRAV